MGLCLRTNHLCGIVQRTSGAAFDNPIVFHRVNFYCRVCLLRVNLPIPPRLSINGMSVWRWFAEGESGDMYRCAPLFAAVQERQSETQTERRHYKSSEKQEASLDQTQTGTNDDDEQEY